MPGMWVAHVGEENMTLQEAAEAYKRATAAMKLFLVTVHMLKR